MKPRKKKKVAEAMARKRVEGTEKKKTKAIRYPYSPLVLFYG
jgi:hypothetical protein